MYGVVPPEVVAVKPAATPGVIVASDVTWYVPIEGEIGLPTFLVCGHYLSDARSATCIAPDLASAVRVSAS